MALLLLLGRLPHPTQDSRRPCECECVMCVVMEVGRRGMPVSTIPLASRPSIKEYLMDWKGVKGGRRGRKVQFSWRFRSSPSFLPHL